MPESSTAALPVQLNVSVQSPSFPEQEPPNSPASNAPPFGLTTSMSFRVDMDITNAPPIRLTVSVPRPSAISATLFLTSPEAEERVAVYRPEFVVGFTSGDDVETVYYIEIQYDDDETFDNAQSVVLPAPVVDGGVVWTPSEDVFDTTYWRARLVDADGDPLTAYTNSQYFTVDASVLSVQMFVRWDVVSSTPRPIHLWHFDPPGAMEGETVTAYGHGFPANGVLRMNGDVIPVQSWALVPPTDNLATNERAIDGDDVDSEHYEVVFTAPAVEEPGGAITVEEA